jgi:hypothetical protein
MTIMTDVAEIKRADLDYLIAQNFYEGRETKEVFSNKRVAAVLGDAAAKYLVNIAARGVDVITQKMAVDGWSVSRNGAKDAAAEAEFRDEVWDHNRLEELIPDAIQAAEEFGDAYLVVWPEEREESSAVDVYLHRPIGARMFYDSDNETIALRYVRTWLVRGGASTSDQSTWLRRVTIIDAKRVRKLISTVPASQLNSDDQFVPFVDEDDPDPDKRLDDTTGEPLPPGETPHFYEQIPVFHLRTSRPYGTPAHACLYGVQNLLTKFITTLGESADGFALPWRYRTINADKLLSPGTDVFDQDQRDEDEEDDRVVTRAGELTNLYGTDNVGQLTPADSKNMLDPIDRIMALGATVSAIPMDYFDPSSAAASGVSKKEHKSAYHTKVRGQIENIGGAITAALEFAMNAVLEAVDVSVELVWREIAERTPEERYEQITAAVAAGVPWPVACVEAGYPQEVVDEWVKNGWAPEDSAAARVELFKGIAAGTRDLAAAANLGGIDATAAQALIEKALSRPTESGRGVVGG